MAFADLDGGGDGVCWGGCSTFFFLPPMTPSPPFGFFGGSLVWGGGDGCFGSGGGMGVRSRCGAGSGSDSDAVAWSVSFVGRCGEGLFFFALDTEGFLARSFSRGGVSCR